MFDEWKAQRRFKALSRSQRSIVFYSEGTHNWPHLAPIIHSLVHEHRRPVCYLTSDRRDPGLGQEGLEAFLIGDGTIRTIMFKTLDADVLVTTTPDLETLQLKRSVHPVYYVYVHHSSISTHMAYRQDSFDNFDEIFCVGPHHVDETRETERVYGLPKKALFEHGYGRLDTMLSEAKKAVDTGGPPRVLLAPSWGPQGLLETIGADLIQILLAAGISIVVRPHPETQKRSPKQLAELVNGFKANPLFSYEENIASSASLHNSDIMISDWSGAAIDFALGLTRPVLFVDVPRKIRNEEYKQLKAEPFEVKIRPEIGAILDITELADAPNRIGALLADRSAIAKRIHAARDSWIFNPGSSGATGAARVMELAGKQAPARLLSEPNR